MNGASSGKHMGIRQWQWSKEIKDKTHCQIELCIVHNTNSSFHIFDLGNLISANKNIHFWGAMGLNGIGTTEQFAPPGSLSAIYRVLPSIVLLVQSNPAVGLVNPHHGVSMEPFCLPSKLFLCGIAYKILLDFGGIKVCCVAGGCSVRPGQSWIMHRSHHDKVFDDLVSDISIPHSSKYQK